MLTASTIKQDQMQDFINSIPEEPTVADLRELKRQGVDIKEHLTGDDYADAIISELVGL